MDTFLYFTPFDLWLTSDDLEMTFIMFWIISTSHILIFIQIEQTLKFYPFWPLVDLWWPWNDLQYILNDIKSTYTNFHLNWTNFRILPLLTPKQTPPPCLSQIWLLSYRSIMLRALLALFWWSHHLICSKYWILKWFSVINHFCPLYDLELQICEDPIDTI